jgi:hypothetical protein
MQQSELPYPVWSGSFRLLGVELKCHTLSNGQRIIEAESMHTLLKMLGDETGHSLEEWPPEPEQAEAFARWSKGL